MTDRDYGDPSNVELKAHMIPILKDKLNVNYMFWYCELTRVNLYK